MPGLQRCSAVSTNNAGISTQNSTYCTGHRSTEGTVVETLKVGVRRQQRCRTRDSPRMVENQVTVLLSLAFFCGNPSGGRARPYCAESNNLNLAQRGRSHYLVLKSRDTHEAACDPSVVSRRGDIRKCRHEFGVVIQCKIHGTLRTGPS